jgi:hypothetical protein
MSNKKTKEDHNNNKSSYCIAREISEDEAVISLAEGWSTAEPPTEEMLANSYYAKAFEMIKTGRLTWNWAAAIFGGGWLLYHKMYGSFWIFYSLTLLSFPSLLTLFTGNSSPSWLDLVGYLNFIPFVGFGLFGNNLLLHGMLRKSDNGYHKLKKYKGTYGNASLFYLMILLVIYCSAVITLSSSPELSIVLLVISITAFLAPLLFISIQDFTRRRRVTAELFNKKSRDERS